MDITKRKITKIAREVNKFTVRTLRAEGIGASEFDVIHAVRKNPGITQAEICRITGLDQIGAFMGPVLLYLVLLYLVMLFKTEGTTFEIYSFCFAVLAIPGFITLILLLLTKHKFPNPENFEPDPKEYVAFKMKKEFVFYIAGISFFAFGFVDYSLIIMHVSNSFAHLSSNLVETSNFINTGTLPLLYAGAMLVDAVAALFFD